MGIAHVDLAGPAVGELLGLVGTEDRLPHVHRRPGRAGCLARHGTRRSASRPGVDTVNVGGVTRPASTAAWARQRIPFPLISATPPSALRRSMARSASPAAGDDPDHPVGADAEPPVAQGADQRPGPAGSGVVDVHQDQEVVAGTVVLGQVEDGRVSGVGWLIVLVDQSPTAAPSRGISPKRAAIARHRVVIRVQPHDTGIAAEPGHLPPGEGPGPPDGLVDGVGRGAVPSSRWARSSR